MTQKNFNWDFPYMSRRMPVIAGNIVATSQPLAAQAGISMIQNGGNAVDAAIATAIALTVVEPVNNGIGSDAYAIIWDGKRLHGINGSGKSPAGWTYEKFSSLDEMPMRGWDSVTVPGAVSVWVELSSKFGRLSFGDLFEPAIKYATDGFPVSPKTGYLWSLAEETFKDFPEFVKTFLPTGRAPKIGEIFKREAQARTLKEIADTKGESFYRGELAGRIAGCSKDQGGALDINDLANHKPEWVETISNSYRGYDLHELPPNGQGLAALIALGILDQFDIRRHPVDSADSIHIQIESMKLAFADIRSHLADPDFMTADYRSFLDCDYLASRAKLIDMYKAGSHEVGIPHDKGTVYLTAADSEGMMVSFIQSNFWGFGSGIVIPDTGISMQNRGYGFSLEKGHPNQVDGGKRPYHTIIPAFVTCSGKPVMSFGVMGGHFQPQGHIQMMTRIFDYRQNPQAASDAPRWYVMEDNRIAIEPGLPAGVLDDLTKRGHDIALDIPESMFGGAQLIYRLDDSYLGASDHRKDGLALGF
ncbi:MAG: gamma-glutamyltransferase family protein [candidate division Zixibacteria bacterium]|nr:gamma-glutamyltransferase family protein [candidate division Zixibacteria bacterium]